MSLGPACSNSKFQTKQRYIVQFPAYISDVSKLPIILGPMDIRLGLRQTTSLAHINTPTRILHIDT